MTVCRCDYCELRRRLPHPECGRSLTIIIGGDLCPECLEAAKTWLNEKGFKDWVEETRH